MHPAKPQGKSDNQQSSCNQGSCCAGTKQPAEQGQLIFLNGGDRELFDRITPLLDVMGKAKFYLGPVSTGSTHCSVCTRIRVGTVHPSLVPLSIGAAAIRWGPMSWDDG